MPTGPGIAAERMELLEPARVLQSMQTRAARGPLALLNGEAKRLGYVPTGAKDVLGYRYVAVASREVKPSKGELWAPFKEVSFELNVQSFTKKGSKDQAALVTVTIQGGSNTDTREMLLIAPGGNFASPREFVVQGNKIVPAKSWWTAMKKCLQNRCIAVCVAALINCRGTWAAYLACVASTCGVCWVKCAACAACNCKGWCKWAVGCCKQ